MIRLLPLLFTTAIIAAPATEKLPGLETVHGMLDNGRGQRVQTILTRPANAQARLPALLLIQWLSCDGSEVPQEGRIDGSVEFVKRLAMQSKFVMLRVEKPGIGASEGSCGDADFQTELAGYRAGLAMLRSHPWVDPERIILVGHSNGAGVLPVVATDAAGYLVVNGWSKTWFEHMIETLRRLDELSGKSPAEVSSLMRGYAELYSDYLAEKKIPGNIIQAKPHLAKFWTDEPQRQYGRPAAFYHQLQELNLSEAWSKVSAPTLVIFGEYDALMSQDDHARIVALVNKDRPGAARLIVVPKMDHGLFVHDSMEKGFKDYWSGRFAEEMMPPVLEWLRSRG